MSLVFISLLQHLQHQLMSVKTQLSLNQKQAQKMPRQPLLKLLRTPQLRKHLQIQAASQLKTFPKPVLSKRCLRNTMRQTCLMRRQTISAGAQSWLQMIPQQQAALLMKPLLEPCLLQRRQQSPLEVKTQLACRPTVMVKFLSVMFCPKTIFRYLPSHTDVAKH